MKFNFQLSSTFIFLGFNKNGLHKSFSLFKDLSEYEILSSHVDWCKFCTNLRSFNVRHF
jgi:hypothetical protein